MSIPELLKLVEAAAPIIEGLVEGGTKAVAAVREALKDEGIDVDTARLDAIIIDAEARRDRAKGEAGGTD